MTAQLTFPWGHPPAFGEDSFFVGPNNRDAFDALKKDALSCGPKTLFLWGEKACGKTHLAHIWASHMGASFLSESDLAPEHLLERLHQAQAFVLEDLQNLTQETPLFHLLNAVKEKQVRLLVTSRVSAALLPFKLADLRSRVLALESLTIALPEEAVASAFLHKRFADLHMKPPKGLIAHILARAPRSYAALDQLTYQVWEASLKQKRRPTLPLLKEILEESPLLTS